MRSRLSRLIATAAFAWASTTALAQGVATLQDMRKVTDAAMELVGKGDLDAGLKSFRTLAIVPKAEFDTLLAQAAMHAPTMTSRFGNSRGYEFIEEKWVGKSLVRLTYLHKYDLHGTRWVFYCYLGKDGWVINTFRFDDKLHELF